MKDSNRQPVRILNGYRVLYKPEYESSMNNDNWCGYVYEHIYVMEQNLRRKLVKGEVVHHLDGNRGNNRIENLIVLSRGDHTKLHEWLDSGAFIHESYERNGMNSGKSKVTEPEYCEVCQATLQGKQKHTCSKECAGVRRERLYEASRGFDKPSKEQLAQDIENLSWLAIGRKYNVSDNGARKWAKKYGLL